MRVSASAPRRATSIALALALLLLCGSALANLRGWFLDVGQGDAALFVSPSGKVVLVDAGPAGSDDVIRGAMAAAGVEAIDLVVLTHAHVDHIGGLRGLLSDIPVRRVLDSGFDHPTRAYSRLLEALQSRKVPIDTARRGQVIDLGGGVEMRVLGPREPLLAGTRSDPNANSIIARLVHGDVAVMLTGDAEAPTETRLLQDGGVLQSTVLKVAHHGSEHATSMRFLGAVQPKAGVVSCGHDNKYGHPREALLGRLKARRVPLYRTDLDGTIAFRTDGKRWAMAAQRVPTAQASTDAPVGATEVAASTGLIDVNTASVQELVSLPGIGPKKAQAIVESRSHGPFVSVEDLRRVHGIGPKTVAKLRDLVTVDTAPAAP